MLVAVPWTSQAESLGLLFFLRIRWGAPSVRVGIAGASQRRQFGGRRRRCPFNKALTVSPVCSRSSSFLLPLSFSVPNEMIE